MLETQLKDIKLVRKFLIGDYLKRIKSSLKYMGPAFIVSVAYIDPGNFATNITAGSVYNYNLIWVILWSNLAAIFLQSLSAKVGIATGFNISALCRKLFSKEVNWVLWSISCITAMATTLAEFLGGTLGIYLLFRIPLVYSGIITSVLTFAIVNMQRYGQRTVEIVITILVAAIGIAYSIEVFLAKPDFGMVGLHVLIPYLPNSNALLVAVGMLGATVMPHVIFLHSELVQQRNSCASESTKRKLLKMEKMDISIAMNVAFLVNAAMVVVSAAVFYKHGVIVESIEQAHRSLQPLMGSLSSGAFGMALLASGLSSSAVGAMAGENLLSGFVDLKINVNIRRIITMLPGLVIIILGISPMKSLIISQVILSFALPSAIIPLMLISSRKNVMGCFVNKLPTKVLGWIIVSIIIILNVLLLYMNLF